MVTGYHRNRIRRRIRQFANGSPGSGSRRERCLPLVLENSGGSPARALPRHRKRSHRRRPVLRPSVWDVRGRVADGALWLACCVRWYRPREPAMGAGLEKVDAARPGALRAAAVQIYPGATNSVQPLLLGSLGRPFLQQLFPVLLGDVAAILSDDGTPPNHDCNVKGRRRVLRVGRHCIIICRLEVGCPDSSWRLPDAGSKGGDVDRSCHGGHWVG